VSNPYGEHSDLATEQARDARARAWAFVFECHARKEGALPGAPDARKESNGSGKISIPN
jgi:hypothetical protein